MDERLATQLRNRALEALDSIPSIAELMATVASTQAVPAEDTALLEDNRAQIAAWLADVEALKARGDEWQTAPNRVLRERFLRWALRKNPYVSPGPADEAALDDVFRKILRGLRKALATDAPSATILAATASTLRDELASVLRGIFGNAPPTDVACAGYSVSLQERVLGIAGETLLAPVLDLGCGPRGDLVESLRARGITAEGIDRDLEVNAPHLRAADWLAQTFAPNHYGTIVSHQGFSLHFLHAHLSAGDGARAYATKYMELLRALRVGGSFIYAPGLPFIERLLPAAWRVTRKPLPEGLGIDVAAALAKLVGEDVMYTASVMRLAQ